MQAPWSGYDTQPAAAIVARIRAADEATKAVTLLYERGHKGRASVIRPPAADAPRPRFSRSGAHAPAGPCRWKW